MESINDWRNNKYAVLLLFGVKKVWERNIPQIVAMFTEVLWWVEAPFFAGKKMTASKTRKADQQDLSRSGRPVAAVNSEMLQRADSIVR